MLKKVWRKRTFLCCWWEYELVQPLWRTVRRLLKKLKTELLLYDPAIPLLGIYPEKTFNSKRWVYPSVNLLLCSVAESCLILCNPMDCSKPGSFVFHCLLKSLLKRMSIESVMLSNHIILCHPLPLLPSVFPSIRVFPVSQLFTLGGHSIGVSASAAVLQRNIQGWYPLGLTGLISLLSRGLTSLLQHHNSNVSILWHSTFFMIQLSHPYVTTGKTISLIRQSFVSKVVSVFLIHCVDLS